jgi:hypothetical protein
VNAQEWLGVFAILLVVVVLFGGLRLYQVIAQPEPEHVRKLFHACGGLFGLPRPWIFDRLVPVLLLGALIAAAFVTIVLAQIAGSVFWLLVYHESDEAWAFYPFVACYAVNVAIIALLRQKFAVPNVRWFRALWANVAKGMIVALPSILLMDGLTLKALLDLAACLGAVLAATALFYRLQPALSTFPVDGPRWIRQSLIVAWTSVIALTLSPHQPSLSTALQAEAPMAASHIREKMQAAILTVKKRSWSQSNV